MYVNCGCFSIQVAGYKNARQNALKCLKMRLPDPKTRKRHTYASSAQAESVNKHFRFLPQSPFQS